jgi:peptidoglycan hydrolase-like protein with peptidoglycan-binding domain
MPNPELAAALKQAKAKPMFFAFIHKGAEGKLIVSKTKIPPKQIAEAKKETGGGTPVTGKCFGGEGGAMVFQVAKAAPPALAAAVKKPAKRDAGLMIEPEFQLGGDADADEQAAIELDTTGGPTDSWSPAAAPAAPPAAPAGGKVLGIQKALHKLGFDPGKIDGVNGPHTQAAIKKFQQSKGLAADGIMGPKTQAALAIALKGGAAPSVAAKVTPTPVLDPQVTLPELDAASKDSAKMPIDLGPWVAARQHAVTNLKALASKVAATKHGRAVGVLKEISSIITRLPAKPGAHELDKLEHFITNDETITAAEEVPAHFHDLDIREPLLKALAAMRQ